MGRRGPKGPIRTSFKPGYDPRRGNGRPGGFREFRLKILEKTHNLEDAIDLAVEQMNNKKLSPKDRIYSAQFLTEYGFGKPPQKVELDVDIVLAIEAMTIEERKLRLLELARRAGILPVVGLDSPIRGELPPPNGNGSAH